MDLDARGRVLQRLRASRHGRSNCSIQSGTAADRTKVHPRASSEAGVEIKAVLVSDRGRRPYDQSQNATFYGKSNAGSYSYICRRPYTFAHRAGKGPAAHHWRCARNIVIAETIIITC